MNVQTKKIHTFNFFCTGLSIRTPLASYDAYLDVLMAKLKCSFYLLINTEISMHTHTHMRARTHTRTQAFLTRSNRANSSSSAGLTGSLRKLANSWMEMRPPLQELAMAAKPSSSFCTFSHFRLQERGGRGTEDGVQGQAPIGREHP